MAIDITAIGIGVDTSKLRQGTKDLDSFGKSANKAAGNADASTKSMSGMTAIAGRLAIVLGAAGLAKSLISIIDANTKYTAQLKLATQTQEQFNLALSDVQRIARTAQSDIGSVATLYARLNTSLRDVGVSQAEVARITENVGLALKVSGATANESSSAILQLSQAFASGVLRGEEFNAVSESAPALMQALGKSMGVPIGQLRAMAAEGLITGEVLNKAFSDEKLLESFRNQAKEVQTIAGSFTQLKNALSLLVGEVSTSSGAGNAFAIVLSTIAKNLESVANVIKGDLKSAFDSILPAYREFKKLQDKESSRALPQATTPSGNIIAQGARIDEPLKRDLGLITDNSNAFAALREQFNKFKTDNPLKDATSANEEYAQSIALVRANVLAMNITQAEGQRYEEQLKKILDSASKIKEDTTAKDLAREAKQKNDAYVAYQNEFAELTKKYQDISMKAETKIIDETRDAKIKADKEVMEIRQRQANENFKNAQDIAKKETSAMDDAFKELKNAVDGYSRDMARSLAQFAMGGKVSFADMIDSMLLKLLEFVNQKLIFDPLFKAIGGAIDGSSAGGGLGGFISGIAGGIGNFFTGGVGSSAGAYSIDENPYLNFSGGRANGGNVYAGKSYMVGERGAEMFVPTTNGSIVSNNKMGGGNTNVIVNVIEAEGTKANVQQQQNPDGTMSISVIVEQLYGVMNRDLQRGGGIAPTLERRYGLNRLAGA
jgi:tape measure domain-containing protein